MSGGEVNNSECKLVTGTLKVACSFCKTKTTDELKFGPVYESNGLVVHYFCLLTASNLPQNGQDEEGILGFYLTDIRNELKLTATRACTYCNKKGASVNCCSPRCRRWFHLTCGRKNNSLHQFFGRFKSFCSSHRPKQRVRKEELDLGEKRNEMVCPICYEHIVVDSLDTMWAPCCKKNAWFHTDCVQKLALSAGYFFKCPLCNNEATFREAMQKFGIYIPQRDALWEQVPNAYQELLYQYRRCDARECKCPRGRNHNGQSNWELVRCKTCGSQGIHISCGRLKFSNPEWLCSICTNVLKRVGAVQEKAAPRSRSSSSASSSTGSDETESSHPNIEPADDESQLSSGCNSDESSRQRRSKSTTSRVTRSNPSPTPSNKPGKVSNPGVISPPIKRSKPCPKRFKKNYVESETEDRSIATKTETSLPKVDTSISLLKEYPLEDSPTNNITVIDTDSDEEIEVLEVHRVLERKSLTANDGTKLEVHPVAEKKKVFYEIRDFPEPCTSIATSGTQGSEVLTSHKLSEESSASSTPSNTVSWRSVDPKLFYKPSTSSTEKCDRLTEETSGSTQSILKENFEALVKGSACKINQIRSPPPPPTPPPPSPPPLKTYSAKTEGKVDSLKPSVTVIPLSTGASPQIPIENFLETAPSRPLPPRPLLPRTLAPRPMPPRPLPSEPLPPRPLPPRPSPPRPSPPRPSPPRPSPPRPSSSWPLKRNNVTSVALPNQNIGLRLGKANPPSRRKSIEEITIIDEAPSNIPVTTPATSTNLPNFQPQIVNVRSCRSSGPTVVGSAVVRPVAPMMPHTGSVLNTNVIFCTTGLWIPTSESFLAAPLLNAMPQTTTQPVPSPAMALQAMETDLNIKISDVRHSNEFFNSPSNSLNSPMTFRAAGEIGGRTTLSLPPSMNAITPPLSLSNLGTRQPPPRPPTISEISAGAHLTASRFGQVYRLRAVAPQMVMGQHQALPQNISSSDFLRNRLTRPNCPLPTPERNSAPDVIVLE